MLGLTHPFFFATLFPPSFFCENYFSDFFKEILLEQVKMANTVTDMAKHAILVGIIVGTLAFLYMGVFGHGAPTRLAGPFFAKSTKSTTE
jgi:hypothetical protein